MPTGFARREAITGSRVTCAIARQTGLEGAQASDWIFFEPTSGGMMVDQQARNLMPAMGTLPYSRQPYRTGVSVGGGVGFEATGQLLPTILSLAFGYNAKLQDVTGRTGIRGETLRRYRLVPDPQNAYGSHYFSFMQIIGDREGYQQARAAATANAVYEFQTYRPLKYDYNAYLRDAAGPTGGSGALLYPGAEPTGSPSAFRPGQIAQSTAASLDPGVVVVADAASPRAFYRNPGVVANGVWAADTAAARTIGIATDYQVIASGAAAGTGIPLAGSRTFAEIKRVFSVTTGTLVAGLASVDWTPVGFAAVTGQSGQFKTTNVADPPVDAASDSVALVVVFEDDDYPDIQIPSTYNPYADAAAVLPTGGAAYDIDFAHQMRDATEVTSAQLTDAEIFTRLPWETDFTKSAYAAGRTQQAGEFRIGDFEDVNGAVAGNWVGRDVRVAWQYQVSRRAEYPQEIFTDCKIGAIALNLTSGGSVTVQCQMQGRVPTFKELLGRDVHFDRARVDELPLVMMTQDSYVQMDLREGMTFGMTDAVEEGKRLSHLASQNVTLRTLQFQLENMLTEPDRLGHGSAYQPDIQLLGRMAAFRMGVELQGSDYYREMYYEPNGTPAAPNDLRWKTEPERGNLTVTAGNADRSYVMDIKARDAHFSSYMVAKAPQQLVLGQVEVEVIRNPVEGQELQFDFTMPFDIEPGLTA